MSVTTSKPAGLPLYDSIGSLFRSTRQVTLDASYATGGEPVTAAAFGLRRILSVDMPTIIAATGGVAPKVVRISPLVQTDGSILLNVRVLAEGTPNTVVQATAADDLSGLVCIVTVYGL